MADLILFPTLFVICFMTCLFLLALIRKDNSLADIGWGIGFIGVSLLMFFLKEEETRRQILVFILVCLWGIRLSIHIFMRNKGKGEDFRYAKWRRDWGKWFVLRSYFQFFILQGILLLLIVFPVILINASKEKGLKASDIAGTVIWLIGFFFEAVGDFQLLQFKQERENKGKIMTRGLWKYTRHPNYFGEASMWWGIFLIAVSVENGWLAFISPLTLSFLLLRVSGIPLLEKKYAGNPEFTAYARRTNAFFPWFPRKK